MTTCTHTIRRLTAPAVLALALGLALGLTAPAHASSTSKSDPRGDYPTGSAPGIDLAGTRLKTEGGQRIQVTFALHAPVSSDSLGQPGGLAVDFVKSKRTIRAVRIHTVDGVLQGDVCSYDRRKRIPLPQNCSPVAVAQVDATTYRAEVALKQLKKGARVLQWRAGAAVFGGGPATIDMLVPEKGTYFRWRL